MSSDWVDVAPSPVGAVAFSFLGTVCLSFIMGIVGLFWAFLRLLSVGPRRFFKRIPRPVPPNQATDFIYGSHEMLKLKSSGITLHYVTKGLPNQPMILFVHGFPECWYSWRYQMKHFARNYRVVAIDTRGYGLSSKPSYVADYRLETLASDVADVIEQLGYESCILVGHDLGGMVAYMTATIYPHLVEKLIVMNCPHPATFHTALNGKQLLRSWYMFFYQSPLIPEWALESDNFSLFDKAFFKKPMGLVNKTNMTKEDLDVIKYTFAQSGTPKAALNYYRAFVRYQPDFSRAHVTAPTLLIWGTLDAALGEELADATQKFCTDLRVRKIPNASHWVQQDVPEECNKYMETFLNEHPTMPHTYDH